MIRILPSLCPDIMLCLPWLWLRVLLLSTGGFAIEIHLPTGPKPPRNSDDLWNYSYFWGSIVCRPRYMAFLWWTVPQTPRQWRALLGHL